MAVLFTNNAASTLAASISNVATSIPLSTGQGARFPSPSGGDFFYATITDVSNNIEIVKCTARSGDSLTVVRAQEGTTGRAFASGDRLELRMTAATVAEFLQKTGNQTLTGVLTATGFTGNLTGDVTGNVSGTAGSASTATTLASTRSITMTGDVSWTVNFNGSGNVTAAGTIAADSVLNTKLANMASQTFKGRTTAGTGDPEDLTAAQATAILNVFDTSNKGLAPASGGGTTNFLRADGTWASAVPNTFTSSDITLTGASSGTVTHGLGARPKKVWAVYKCVNAANGYAVGDEIMAYPVFGGSAAVDFGGVNFYTSGTTNIAYRIASTVTIYSTAGAAVSIVGSANWRLVIKAQL